MKFLKCNLRDLKKHTESSIDVFMCCGSFEDRCFSVASSLDPATVKKALVMENKNLGDYVAENTKHLREQFAGRAVDVPIDSGAPLKTADSIKEKLEEVNSAEPLNYLVDVTTFTHESLLILLRLLCLSLKKGDSVKFVYNSASSYSSKNLDDIWLSKGVADIRSVLGYPGEILPTLKTHLIVLVGYEYERASRFIEVFEPNIISLGYGKAGSETDPKHFSSNQHFHKLLHDAVAAYTTVNDFEFSCSNPWGTKEAIVNQAQTTPNYNIIVAPMNTKISTIGSAIASFENTAIQLCYAQAHLYNFKNYSIPSDRCYVFELPELYDEVDS